MVVTVLGTGLMGFGMAARLAAEGLDTRAWNRTTDKAQPLAEQGVTVCDDVADAVTGADVVITMLWDADVVADVITQALPRLGDGVVWLQMSTVGPQGAKRLAEVAAQHAIATLDAPVLGTKKPAADGTLVVLVSGDRSLADRVQPVLSAIGTKTVWASDELGDASRLKLACNAWVLTISSAAAQSVAMAEAMGLDPQLFLDAIDGTATDCAYAHLKGGQMISGDYTASFPVSGGLKDQSLMRSAIEQAGLDSALIDAVGRLNQQAADRGHGDDDLAAVYFGFGADR